LNDTELAVHFGIQYWIPSAVHYM